MCALFVAACPSYDRSSPEHSVRRLTAGSKRHTRQRIISNALAEARPALLANLATSPVSWTPATLNLVRHRIITSALVPTRSSRRAMITEYSKRRLLARMLRTESAVPVEVATWYSHKLPEIATQGNCLLQDGSAQANIGRDGWKICT